jgi:TPR repeat protein
MAGTPMILKFAKTLYMPLNVVAQRIRQFGNTQFRITQFIGSMTLSIFCVLPALAYKPTKADLDELEHARTAANAGKYEECYNGVCHVAVKGHPQAESVLGQLYEKGIGVEKNTAKAEMYYKKAASKGVKEAQARLGMMLYKGEGLAKDPKAASKWLKMAANQNVAEAQYNLGNMYLKGEGVPMNLQEGSSWLHRAAANGFTAAEGALADLPAVKPITGGTKSGAQYQEGMSNLEHSWQGYSDLAGSLQKIDTEASATR